jgi:cell wall-active antibiotic response 4TMS protein YvqF
MKHSNIFWGMILISVGVLFILKNLDVLCFDWGMIFSLWPLLLVLWGITIIPIKAVIKLVLSIVALTIGVLIIFNSPNHYSWENWNFNNNSGHGWEFRSDDSDEDYDSNSEYQQEYDDEGEAYATQDLSAPFDPNIEFVDLIVDAAIGEFEIKEATDEFYHFNKAGNLGPYRIGTSKHGNSQELKIVPISQSFTGLRFKNETSLKLNPNPIWDMTIDVGAAEIDLDLRPFKVKNFDIDGGASSIQIIVGDKYPEVRLDIDAAAASIEIKVPEMAGCLVDVDTFITSKTLLGFEKNKNGNYQTPGYKDAETKIIINLNAAIASFSVQRY